MSGGSKHPIDPSKSCPVEQSIPGWKEMVHPYRKDGVWASAGMPDKGEPDKGELRNIMVRTRNQFHYAVRRVKTMSKSIRARKLLEASESGSVNLLAEMKKIKGGKSDHGDLPECVAEVNGEEKIVEAFKDVYSKLYKDELLQFKRAIQSEISEDCVHEANKITGAVVKEAAGRMKPGKADVSTSYQLY